jgi:hypothetical protein
MGSHDCVEWRLYVEQAVQEGVLEAESRGYAVAQEVIKQGFATLSPEQRRVYVREVLPALNEMARREYVRERCYQAPVQGAADANSAGCSAMHLVDDSGLGRRSAAAQS